MEIEFDEAKRLQNIVKHGLDFRDAALVLGAVHLAGAARSVSGEVRELAVGLLEGRVVTIVYTRRQGRPRIISMRRARDDERRKYHAVCGG